MADSASDSYFQSDKLGLKHISSSLFNIPGFFVGFSSKSASDIDSVWSPTSALDFSFFSTLSNPFSRTPPKSTSQSAHQKKWDCINVGLGIVNSLTEQAEPTGVVVNTTKKKNVSFGLQVKTSNPVRSNSLPKNYIISLLSQSGSPTLQLGKADEEVPPDNRIETRLSFPLIICGGSQTDGNLDIKPGSLPTPTGSGQGHVGSLTVRDIELSEDYTCIISRGPNPKTTHIFGDCILECHASELSSFDQIANISAESPQEAKRPEGPPLHPSNEFFSFCHSCKKKLENGDDILIYRGNEAFCSFVCQSKTMFAEEETGETCDDFARGSNESSYHEDLFLIS